MRKHILILLGLLPLSILFSQSSHPLLSYDKKIIQADSLLNNGEYELATSLSDSLLAIIDVENQVSIARLKNIKGYALVNIGKYDVAKNLLQDAEKYWLSTQDTINAELGTIYYNLADLYDYEGDLSKGLNMIKKSLTIREKIYGDTSKAYTESLHLMAYLVEGLGEFKEAEKLYLQAKKLHEQLYGREHEEYIDNVINLGNLYGATGDYEKTEKYLLEAMMLSKQVFGTEHSAYAKAVNNLAVLYQTIGKYDLSEKYLIEANSIRKRIFGRNHPDYAIGLTNLGVLNYLQGFYDEAAKYFSESASIKLLVYGKTHPSYANSLHNLSAIYLLMGDSEKAESNMLEVISIEEKTITERSPDFAISLDNLGDLYQNIGNYDKATSYFLRAKNLREEILGTEHKNYGISLSKLANLYTLLGEFNKAKPLFENALSNIKLNFGVDHEQYANILTMQGSFFFKREEYDNAQSNFLKAKDIREKLHGQYHYDYIQILQNLFNLYTAKGNYNDALSITNNLTILRDSILPSNHPDFIPVNWNYANLYQKIGNSKKAESYAWKYYNSVKEEAKKAFGFLSEREKENFLRTKITPYYNSLHASAFRHKYSDEFMNLQYEIALTQKSQLLSINRNTFEFLLNQEDSIAIDKFQKLRGVRQLLSKNYRNPLKQKENIYQLQIQEEELEKDLAKRSASYRNTLEVTPPITIQQNLASEEAALELISFSSRYDNSSDSIFYAALILTPNKQNASFTFLFERKQLQEILVPKQNKQTNLLSEIYASRGIVPKKQKLSKQIYNLVWQPIDSLLQAENIRTIYYSPTGLLHRLNLSALPIDSTQVLGDKYKMVQLSSTRLLAIDRDENNKENTAYIIGGVQYNYKNITHPFINNFHEAIYTWLEEQPDSVLQNSGVAYSESTNDNYFSYVDRSLRGDSWTYLPGTKEETQSISALLNQKQYEVNYLSGNAATEADFKQLGTSTKSPKIIHLATHGFFFPDPVDSLRNNSQEPIFKMSEHPMLRSGLLLAGANRVWGGEETPINEEDGILTAYEISNMNLTNTELVVLSACETGLGDIQGSEGVYGLQRAFKKAGVRYLIMSLWQVPDRETSLFMQTFYQNYLEKEMSINDAFDATQKAMRAQFDDPYLWAGFVLME